jgi:hypothetical protein
MFLFLGLPTVNNTDVKGFYDIQIGVTPEDFNLMMAKAAVTRGVPYSVEELAEINAATPQSFIDGLDKAGLKVEKGKAPLDVINIDELKKTPTENSESSHLSTARHRKGGSVLSEFFQSNFRVYSGLSSISRPDKLPIIKNTK